MLKTLFIIISVALVVTAVVFMAFRVKKTSLKAAILKSAATVLCIFATLTAVAMRPENAIYGLLIAAGMVLGLVGDIWLDLKYVHSEYDKAYTMSGITCFMIGHILYIIAILSAYPEYIPWQIALAVFSALAISVIERIISNKTGFDYGYAGKLTFVYSVVIMMTVTFSLNAMNAFGWLPMLGGAEAPDVLPKFVTMNIGTLIFALSDLSLSMAFFKKGGNTKLNVVITHITYYAAQYLLVLSVLM